VSVHVIRMPDIGEGIAEVELVAWRVQPGDAVAEDQILADVMTDKATVEIPSPVTGRVLSLGGEVGQMMAVGSDLIHIETAGAAAAEKPPPTAPAAPQAAAAAASPAAPPKAPPPAATPAPAPALAVMPAPVPAAPPATSAPPAVAPGPRVLASPSVRARAWELGVDLSQLQGSGTAGRIVHADLDAALARGGQAAPPAVPRPAPAPARGAAADDATEVEKIVGLRRRIAQRMQDTKRRIPHFGYVDEVDVGELEALRARLNERWGEERGRLNPLPFIVRAIVVAAPEFPEVNACFDDEAGLLTRHRAVHVGVATQAPAGLMVPVLRHAQRLDLWAASAEISRLAGLARSGKIARDDLSGSTITITSLGRQGGLSTTPVINSPETAIVAVNRIAARAVVRDGAIVARPTMMLSGSFDHRIVDGARAAGFMQRVRELLEHPALLFVE
jgi:2-oxoisovalerate dehydrogenase E2 component (dihydrolipoyl transacylase)